MTKEEFSALRPGDTVRGKLPTSLPYIVTANYGDRVTAVRSADMTNPDEWELVATHHDRTVEGDFRQVTAEIADTQHHAQERPMTGREARLWAEASRIAEVALRTYPKVRGDRSPQRISEDDPLAWWCLTESIVGIAKRYARSTDAGTFTLNSQVPPNG